MSMTLAQLRALCKQESDNVNSSFVADAEWTSYIASSYKELYGLLVTAYGEDYFVQTPYSFTTDGVNQLFSLPNDFFKLLGVDLQVTAPSYYVSLKPFAFAERNKMSTTNNLVPYAGQTVRLLYVPRATELSGESDSVDGINGWEEYVIVDACIKALAKEESDVSVVMARKAALLKRIEGETRNRDAGSPATIADVYGRRARAMQYRISGSKLWLIGNGMPGWGPFGDWGNDAESGFW